MKNRLLSLLLVFVSMVTFAQENMKIKGYIKGLSPKAKISFSSLNGEIKVPTKGGHFEIVQHLDKEPMFVHLYVKDGNIYTYVSFFVGNETVEITTSLKDLKKGVKAVGSKYDDKRYEYDLLTNELKATSKKLSEECSNLHGKEGVDVSVLFDKYYSKVEPKGKIVVVEDKLKQIEYSFLEKNINTAYGRYLLPSTKDKFSAGQFKKLYDLVDAKYYNTNEVQYLNTLITYKPLQIGDKYYDFTALNMAGKEVHFSDFFKGKYVLLDMSANSYLSGDYIETIMGNVPELYRDQMTYVSYYIFDKLDGMNDYYKNTPAVNMLWNKEEKGVTAKYRQGALSYYMLFDPQGKLVGVLEDFLDKSQLDTWLNK
ncbi:MAG: hypothetical protein LBE34_11420 [Flavobacteriaceae bacterium]|nr:hypothetical protein [Flavobacteriaceae bacterium]